MWLAAEKAMPKRKRGASAPSTAFPPPEVITVEDNDEADRTATLAPLAIKDGNVVADEADRTPDGAAQIAPHRRRRKIRRQVEGGTATMAPQDSTAEATDSQHAAATASTAANAACSAKAADGTSDDCTVSDSTAKAAAADGTSNDADGTAEATDSTANAEDSTANAADGTLNDAAASDRAAQIAVLRQKYKFSFFLDLLKPR
jgi:hypothetical protein